MISQLDQEIDTLQIEQGRLASLPILDDKDRREMEKALVRIERRYHELLNANPDNPRLLFGLGIQLMNTDRNAMAVVVIERAIKGQETAAAWLNLAGAYKNEHRDDDAERAYRRALELTDKGDLTGSAVAAWAGIGSLYVNRGQPHKVIEYCNRGLLIDAEDRFARWNLGLGHLESGNWAEGWDLYDGVGFQDGGLKPKERKERLYAQVFRKWEGEKGRDVVCYGEQGIGDEVMFFSMLPDLIRDCRSVVLECDGRILDLVRHSFPGLAAVYPTSDAKAPFTWYPDHPEVTHWVPCGSLGKYYRRAADDFPRTPYMTPEPYLVTRWGAALAPYRKLRVALSWKGGLKKTRMDKRSMALESLAPILQTPGCDFFSLQYHQDAADEVAYVGDKLGVPIHHFHDVIASYDRTAAFLSHMDIVVTVCTSLVHLAGAIGTPTLCMTPVMAAWRYQCKGRNPFYGSVEMLRQKEDGEWRDVIERARQRVAGLSIRKQRVRSADDFAAERQIVAAE